MIEITCNKQKYQIPATLEEFTVRQYLVATKEYETDLEFLSCFAGIPIEDLRTQSKAQIKERAFFIHELQKEYSKVNIKDLKEVKEPKVIDFKGQRYNVPEDIEQCTSGQWFDMMNVLKEVKDEISALPYIIAIYCLKTGEKYSADIIAKEQRHLIFRDMNLIEAWSVHAFFLSNDSEYLKLMTDYFHKKPENSQKKKQPATKPDTNN